MYRSLLIISSLLLSSPETAFADQYVMKGMGAYTCAEFGDFYKSSPETTKFNALQWSYGFMSSMNETKIMDSRDGVKDLNSLSSDTLFSMAINYCANNPLKLWEDATVHAYMKLDDVSDKDAKHAGGH